MDKHVIHFARLILFILQSNAALIKFILQADVPAVLFIKSAATACRCCAFAVCLKIKLYDLFVGIEASAFDPG